MKYSKTMKAYVYIMTITHFKLFIFRKNIKYFISFRYIKCISSFTTLSFIILL